MLLSTVSFNCALLPLSLNMTTSCSYDFRSLFLLRSQAILPLHYASAESLNLWRPTAQHNARGHTQPFPFANYVRGIGSIINNTKYINGIFINMSADDSWGAAQTQPELSPNTNNKTAPVITEVVAANESTVEPTGETVVDPTSPLASERKSSLAELANGDRGAINALLAQGLGPHKFLSRYTNQKSVNNHAAQAELFEPDGAASVVDSSGFNVSTSAVVTNEGVQTAPDLETSNLLSGTTPTASVADGVESAPQSPQSPRSARRLGPHRRLKALALAQNIPLPQSPAPVAKSSTSDEGPATPVASGIDVEPAIIHGSPPSTPTAGDDNESDVSSLAYEAFKTELPSSLSEKEKNDSKAQTPSLNPMAVDYLPPSRSTSPSNLAQQPIDDSEAGYINNCCPVPSNWSVPSCIGYFAGVDLFDDLTIGGIHKPLLNHYSHFFATAFSNDSEAKQQEELEHVLKDPSLAVFRRWIYKGELYVNSADGVVSRDMNIDLKILVILWRFAARIQAPLFANSVANAIVNKTITTDDLSAAADEIDAVLKVVAINSTFRLLISHSVILSGIQLGQDHYTWPKSLLSSVLGCLKMGRTTYAAIQMSSKANPCMYHLHPLGTKCKTS